eukprot:scaffold2066_cov229-Ochromonas_danica.AAC.23
MARRGVGTEIYVEEMTKVEQEILLIQHELSDAQKLNDELTKKIERKVSLSLLLVIAYDLKELSRLIGSRFAGEGREAARLEGKECRRAGAAHLGRLPTSRSSRLASDRPRSYVGEPGGEGEECS